jgi:hypothetical protein
MRRWAFFLRPGWLALFVVVMAFAYLCFTVLAPWQLGKNTKTSRENDQIAYSLTADPVPVTTLLPPLVVGRRRPVAAGDGDRALSARRAGAGPAARGRRRPCL